MPYTPPTLREIVRRIVAKVVSRTTLTDLHPSGEVSQLIVAVGREIQQIGQGILTLLNARVLDRAVGDDLDEFGKEVLPTGNTRNAGTRATTYVVLSRATTTGSQVIASGFVVGRQDGVTYVTTEQATIANGQTAAPAVTAICQTVGTSGNAAVGAITRVISTSPGGISVTNTVEASGGTDKESDPSYRARLRKHARTLATSNRLAVEQRVLEAELDDGTKVQFAKAIRSPTEPGVSYVYIDDGGGGLAAAYETVGASTLVASAVGGEVFFFLPQWPARTKPAITKNGSALSDGVDYGLERATGQLRLVTALVATDELEAGAYTAWNGLVERASLLLWGDPADLFNFPPKVAIGTEPLVVGAESELVTILGSLLVEDGFFFDTVAEQVNSALLVHVNNLNIGDPLYYSQLTKVALNVRGAKRYELITPTEDVYVAESRAVRTNADLITTTTG